MRFPWKLVLILVLILAPATSTEACGLLRRIAARRPLLRAARFVTAPVRVTREIRIRRVQAGVNIVPVLPARKCEGNTCPIQ